MYLENSQFHANDTIERLPAFSLRTALAWLGHDECTCPTQTGARANVWLISPPSGGRPSGMRALVDVEFVDPSWSPAEGKGILAEINVCTCRDRIQVDQCNDSQRIAIAALAHWLNLVAGDDFVTGREMKLTHSGHFDVLANGVLLATQVSFEVAHEFVDTDCALREAGKHHTVVSTAFEPA